MPLSYRCETNTKKKGTQCPNYGAEWSAFTKQMLCHLHHPDRRFRQQVKAKQGARVRKRGASIPFSLTADTPQPTPGLDRPFHLPPGAGRA